MVNKVNIWILDRPLKNWTNKSSFIISMSQGCKDLFCLSFPMNQFFAFFSLTIFYWKVGIWNLEMCGFWMFKKKSVCKRSGFWMNLKFGSPTILNLDKWQLFYQKPFVICTSASVFQMIQFLNGRGHSYSPILCKLDHLKSNLQKVKISNFSWF